MQGNSNLVLLNHYVEKWAAQYPERFAMIQFEDGKTVTYAQFASQVDLIALKLLDMGIKKGDRVSTMLLLSPEHILLMYACFKVGAIIAPVDVRLQDHEVVRDLNKIEPAAFVFLGNTPVRDFRQVGIAVQKDCPSVKHFIQFSLLDGDELINGAVSMSDFLNPDALAALSLNADLTARLKDTYASIQPSTPALIIYTTGTTGEPKPALLAHDNILAQNEILKRGLSIPGEELILLVNLPPSHVGCVTEALMTTFYLGGTDILLRIFDPGSSLAAIAKHKVTVLAQIPTQFRMEWMLPNYDEYDLSSLKFVVYAGSAVDLPFLERFSQMAPNFGTGFGMTENAGFSLFSAPGIPIEDMVGQVGRSFDDISPVTIRQPMSVDGSAGQILEDGQMGEICYEGRIVFPGYYNQPEETARIISTDGVLYTGDMGYFKEISGYRSVVLGGRRKFMIKQKGFNVFPDEVSAFVALYPNVAQAETVGVKHRLFDEGIMTFVMPKPGAELSSQEILEYCQGIASYKRPQHVEILPPDYIFPMTRVNKVDALKLIAQAEIIAENLRKEGLWDA